MKKILFILFSFMISTAVEAFPLAIDIHTPDESKSAQFAKVYFLPDWSDKGMSFDGTDEKPCTEVCPQKTSYDCASGQTETYTNSCGLTCSRCVECYGCEAKGYTLTNCPANASCLNDCCNNLYKLMSCDNGYVSDGSSCRTETCSDNPNICTGGKICISGSCQCPNGKTEVGGKCETSTCKNGGITCSGSAGVCNETTGQCVQCMTNSDCGSGKECNANNQCIVPDACAGVTCSGGKSCVDGTCVCPSNQVDNNGTCEAPNCANGGVTCGSGETCNTTTKRCEAVTDPLSLCLQKIAEDDPSAVFVSNFDEFKAVGTGIETVVLTDNIDAADKSFTLKVKNRDTQYINSAHTRKYYNPLTYSLEKGGKITIPECKALLTGGDRFGYGYAYEEPFDFKLTLKEAVINDDIIGNDKEEVSFYVPVSIDAVRVKSKGYGCSVSIYEPCGYGDKVLVYFDRITEVTGISDGVVTEGANVGVKFGDVAVINSYKNGADFGNLYLHGDYSRPFNDMMGWGTRNCPAIIFFKQSRGAFFTVDLLRFDLETDTLNCRYLGLNGATIRTSYNEEYGSGGTIFDFGPYISGDLTVNLFSGCLHNILANRYLCGSGSDLSYSFSGACDQEGKAIKYNEGFSTKCHKLSAGTVKTYSYYPY